MPKAVVFTGHRDIASSSHRELIFERMYIKCMDPDCVEVFIGGARGGDTVAFLAAAKAKADRADGLPIITVVVPATIGLQPLEFRRALERVPDVKLWEMGLEYNRDTLKLRNHKMVDLAKAHDQPEVLAYWLGIERSGTYSCMLYAKRRDVLVSYIKL